MIEQDPDLDAAFFRRMSCGDMEYLTGLAKEFLDESEGHLREFRCLASVGNALALFELAHRCRGAAAMLGFQRLVAIFKDWELRAKVDGTVPKPEALDDCSQAVAAAGKALGELGEEQ